MGGRLQAFLPAWSAIMNDAFVLSVIEGGYSIELAEPLPGGVVRLSSPRMSPHAAGGIAAEVAALCSKGVVERVADHPRLCLSPVFLVPKRSGKYGMILNLKRINTHISPVHFRMETLKSILPLLRPGDWTVSIDLKDAYHHVPIATRSRSLLGFATAGRVYRFKALPFGLKPAPRLFTRLVACVAAFLRQHGLRVFCYLDDWLLAADSKPILLGQLDFLLRTVQALGFLVNWEKSELVPTRHPTFLGAAIDIPAGLARPSRERVSTIVAAALRLRQRRRAPARVWLQFLGYLASLVDVLPDCRLHMRPLQLHLLHHYRPSRDPLTRLVPNPPSTRLILAKWSRTEFLIVGKPLRAPQPTVTLTTDASRQGWGGHCRGRVAFGDWPLSEPRPHINVLEFRTVLLALQSFLPILRRQAVLIRTDNVMVAAYINRQGGTHSSRLNTLAARLWTWCRQKEITPVPTHNPGQENSRSRLPVPGPVSPHGVDPPPVGGEPSDSSSQATSGGPIRISTQCAPPDLLRQDSGPGSVEGGRVLDQVDGPQSLCLPPDLAHPADPPEDSRGRSMGSTNSPVVAEEDLVPRPGRPVRPVSRVPIDAPDPPRPARTADLGDATPEAERAPPDCMAIVRVSGTQAGLSERAASLIASSRRGSTIGSYNSRLAGFYEWCEERGVDPRSAPVNQIADFLVALFDKGRSISTIRGYRSAIDAIHSGFPDGSCMSSSPTLGSLLRAFFFS